MLLFCKKEGFRNYLFLKKLKKKTYIFKIYFILKNNIGAKIYKNIWLKKKWTGVKY